MKSIYKIKVPLAGFFPVPVVLISTIDIKETSNICTVSWVGVVSSEPPHIGISLRKNRLSFKNILKSQEFVINIPDENMIDIVDYCGQISGRKIDKFYKCKLTKESSLHVKAPLIKECPVNFECKVTSITEVGSHHFIIAEILVMHVDRNVIGLKKKTIGIDKVRPIVLCLNEYWSLSSCIGEIGHSKKK